MGGWRGEFFFRAEDGIRGLVRSRGLGDVYKCQVLVCVGVCWCVLVCVGVCWCVLVCVGGCWCVLAVAYTHLTLPTERIVLLSVVVGCV